MDTWNPDKYLKFSGQRTQPSIDLAERIRLSEPVTIIDIGCGPGNSTQILAQKWPAAKIIGLDSSAAMIKKAQEHFPALSWIEGKAENLPEDRKYDLVFSNAALQWITGHETLIPKLWNIVDKGGALAVQIPKFDKMDINTSIQTVLSDDRWRCYNESAHAIKSLHDLNYYYNLLCDRTDDLELWETHYYHVLPSQASIIDFIESTALKIYLDEMSEAEKIDFKNSILDDLKRYYPTLIDGKVFFPFKRIFFIAYKK
jgi:trans-aconitate 2-methyltransferase